MLVTRPTLPTDAPTHVETLPSGPLARGVPDGKQPFRQGGDRPRGLAGTSCPLRSRPHTGQSVLWARLAGSGLCSDVLSADYSASFISGLTSTRARAQLRPFPPTPQSWKLAIVGFGSWPGRSGVMGQHSNELRMTQGTFRCGSLWSPSPGLPHCPLHPLTPRLLFASLPRGIPPRGLPLVWPPLWPPSRVASSGPPALLSPLPSVLLGHARSLLCKQFCSFPQIQVQATLVRPQSILVLRPRAFRVLESMPQSPWTRPWQLPPTFPPFHVLVCLRGHPSTLAGGPLWTRYSWGAGKETVRVGHSPALMDTRPELR